MFLRFYDFTNNKKKFLTVHLDKNYNRNDMYLNELAYFLKCIKKKITPMNSIPEAFEVQKIALEIKRSTILGKKIKIK